MRASIPGLNNSINLDNSWEAWPLSPWAPAEVPSLTSLWESMVPPNTLPASGVTAGSWQVFAE